MGLNFRKSFKIAPGVKMNLSKNGLSTTIGKRGLSVSHGKKGTNLNVGIPGTGVSYTTKISGNRKRKSSSNTAPQFEINTEIQNNAPKTRKTAILLCVFLGWLGVHRFYSGHVGLGVIHLFTAGIGGIGIIIDLILLATKHYRDTEGNILI